MLTVFLRVFIFFFLVVQQSVFAGWAEDTLEKMSLDEKIGQLLMIAVPCNPERASNQDRLFTLNLPTNLDKNFTTDMIRNYHVGSILYICEGTMSEQVSATNYFQQQSKYPLLIAQDLEPGLQRLEDFPRYPKARILGDHNDLDFTYSVGKQIGQHARDIGVHIVFAPVVDVQTCKENPVIHNRSFGTDPQQVADHGAALMHGLQEGGVIVCAKHFPGHGDTTSDSHQALPTLNHDLRRLDEVEFVPFKRVIDEGVDAIMLGHLMLPNIDAENPSSLSPVFIEQLLKSKLSFNGLVFTDALIMKALSKYDKKNEAALKSLMAGCTVAVFPEDVRESFRVIKDAVLDGVFSQEKFKAKVLLVLKTKEGLGLHQKCFFNV